MQTVRTAALLGLTASTLVLGGAAAAGEIVWWTPNWGEARARELATQFESANPGITIRVEITTSDGLPQRVLTALQSGSPPDIMEVQHGWVNSYAQNGLVLPLDDTIQDQDDYAVEAINTVTWDGQLWAIPYRMETRAVLYNRGDFEAAGLDPDAPPETWDELVEAATALTREGKSGFAITGGGEVGNTLTASLPFVWMAGGDIISEDLTTATINQPEAVEGVTFFTDFYKKGLSPASTLENDNNVNRRLFIAEAISMFLGGQFDLVPIATENPEIDLGVMMTPHPEGKPPSGVLGGWSYVIPSDANNPDEAKLFLQFMNTTENQGFFTDTFPVRKSSLELPRFDDPTLATFAAMLPYARPFPIHPAWVQIGQVYFDGIQRILLEEQTVQEAMDEAAEEIQALLDE
jgi:multiple sugar transport system substrate-binding protein